MKDFLSWLGRQGGSPAEIILRDKDVEHSVEVTAATLYEAVATALAALQQDNWVGRNRAGSHNGECQRKMLGTANQARK
jgi:hypothetical protein